MTHAERGGVGGEGKIREEHRGGPSLAPGQSTTRGCKMATGANAIR